MELLHFIFQDGWHFLGMVVLIALIGQISVYMLAMIIAALRGR
jgi:hypothetical protein